MASSTDVGVASVQGKEKCANQRVCLTNNNRKQKSSENEEG